MKKYLSLILVLSSLLLVGVVVHAQIGGGYDLSWWTVDGGGDLVEGGGYTLMGTIGQAEPGPALTGGGYVLAGGFWSGASTSSGNQHTIYLPLVMRNL